MSQPFSEEFSPDFDIYTPVEPPPPPPDPDPATGVAWRLWVRAFGTDRNVTGQTRFDFTVESGRDDPDEQPDPGRAEFTVDVADGDRAMWASPGVAIWLEAASGQGEARAWRRIWTGTITEVRRRYRHGDAGPANEVSISATGPLAQLERLKVPAGMAGAYAEQLDGVRVWSLLSDLGVSTSTTRPAIGHLVNDQLPEHAARWDDTEVTVTAPDWAVFTRTTALPDIVGDERQHELGLHNNQAQNAQQHIGVWMPMRHHLPPMRDPVEDFDALADCEGGPFLFTPTGTSADQARYATGPMSPTGILANGDALGPGSSAVPDIDIYKAWCQAVKDRANDLIEYWEVWNEADSASFFRGTPHELASMTWAAWEVWGDKVVAPSWTASWQNAGRGSGWYVDDVRQSSVSFVTTYFDLLKQGAASRGVPLPIQAVCFHGYGTGLTPAGAAGARVALWESWKAFIRGIGVTLPLWDTEWSLRHGDAQGEGFPDTAATATAWKQSVRDIKAMGVRRQFTYAWTDTVASGDSWTKSQTHFSQDSPVLNAAFRELADEYTPIPTSRRIEFAVALTADRAAVVVVNLAGQSSRQWWLPLGTHTVSGSVQLTADVYAPQLAVVAVPVDDTFAAETWADVDTTTTWADEPATATWVPNVTTGAETTVTLHTVDVWRSGWDHGGVWLIARDPTENPDQTALDHIDEVATASRGALVEQRGGGLQWVSQLSRAADPAPSVDLPARYVLADSESTQSLSGLVNEVTVNYGYEGVDEDGGSIPRAAVTLRDTGSISLFGAKFAVTIDGPLLGKPAATAVANQILLANSRPRERLNQLQLLPLHQLPDTLVYQLLTATPGAVVEVQDPPVGWVPAESGRWRGYLEGWSITGSTGFAATVTLNISAYYTPRPVLEPQP